MRTSDGRVRRAVSALAAGRPVVVSDDTAGDTGAHLVFAADAADATLLSFTVRHSAGFVRVALPAAECDRLNLPPMCGCLDDGSAAAAQRVAVDAIGTGTGISSTDRARTIAALAAPDSRAADFRRPGHVVPVQISGGVVGHPQVPVAAVDLVRLAGRRPAAGLCELVSRTDPTAIARGAEAVEFAVEHGLAVVTIGELVAYLWRTEPQITRVSEIRMPTTAGVHRVLYYREISSGEQHLAVIVGTTGSDGPVPLHVHSECVCGDVFDSVACRCRSGLDSALATMTTQGSGVVVYLRGGAAASERAPQLVEWILRDLGIYSVRLTDDAPGFGLVMFGAIRAHRPDGRRHVAATSAVG